MQTSAECVRVESKTSRRVAKVTMSAALGLLSSSLPKGSRAFVTKISPRFARSPPPGRRPANSPRSGVLASAAGSRAEEEREEEEKKG